MADILITKIHNTLSNYSINIRPFLSGVMSHIKSLENLDKITLSSLLEQATDLTMWFQQDFDVNYITLLKFPPSPVDHQLTEFSQLYELFLDFVSLTFTFTLGLGINKNDYLFLRDLALSRDRSRVEWSLCKLQEILALTETKPEPKTETEDQGIDITDQPSNPQDNDPPPTIDTHRHPMVNPDSELNFELDSELNFELDPELDADIDFEPGNHYYFNTFQDIELTETPSDPIESNDNVSPPPDFDDESDTETDSDFDVDSDSDLDSSFEDLEGTFLTICEAIKKNIPTRRPRPTFSFG